ncbi:MAG: hypothetical protein ABW352_12545 [Polyangiales bacterium]
MALVVGTQVPDLPMIFPGVTPTYATTHAYLLGTPLNVLYGAVLLALCVGIRPAALASLAHASLATRSHHDLAFFTITSVMRAELLALAAARACFGVLRRAGP